MRLEMMECGRIIMSGVLSWLLRFNVFNRVPSFVECLGVFIEHLLSGRRSVWDFRFSLSGVLRVKRGLVFVCGKCGWEWCGGWKGGWGWISSALRYNGVMFIMLMYDLCFCYCVFAFSFRLCSLFSHVCIQLVFLLIISQVLYLFVLLCLML